MERYFQRTRLDSRSGIKARPAAKELHEPIQVVLLNGNNVQ